MLTDDVHMESKNEEQTKIITESKSLEGEFKIEGDEKSCPMTEKEDEIQDDKAEEETLRKSNGLEVAIMLPPPPVLVPLMAASGASSGGLVPTANDKMDEEDVMSLQVLSARSSTPYTVQGVCCASANCETLEATTEVETSNNTCQWKDVENKQNTELKTIEKIDRDAEKHGVLLNGVAHLEGSKKYSRSDLMDIRSEMTIVRPECLEEVRLQRLHFRKIENTTSSNGTSASRNRSYRNPNISNDLMPSFYKRKAAIAEGNNSNSIYDNFKYNDSNSYNHNHENGNNYRRIGSGRISSNRERETINWDYIPEEDPERHNLPDFFNTQSKPQRQQHNKKQELDDNANYVKRGNGESFRSLGGSRHSINSSGEERYNTTASSSNTTNNNKSDEPEWFSCGPTSRLDTIELCGFNESDQQKIRMEMAKNKLDSNNNRQDSGTGQQNKEKKQLAFQFDEFSSTHNGGNKSSSGGQKIPSSKFMPLFNAKKKDEESMTGPSVHSSNQSLNDFFKRNEMPQNCESRKEKLSPTDMPSVDEIEAKWRANLDSRSSDATFSNTSENFKKMLHQLNQQQQQLQHPFGRSTSSSSPPPLLPNNNQQQQHPPMNLFNNENLSNFIKHRTIQQQLFQKQQQQAAFAQLQFNAILNRPDTQMLLLSLARGEISKHGLVVQLANPNLTQTDREAISAALTFSTAGQYHQQMAINSNQQQLIANQLQNLAIMHQQLNKSPASRRSGNNGSGGGAGGAGNYQQNNGNGTPRTYTQEELQSHANFILHNAMLKKKLEEQNLGLQKMLHLQSAMMNNNNSNNNNNMCTPPRGGVANESMAGSKNFNQQQQAHHQINVQQQHQQQQQQQQQHNQRPRKTPNASGSRNNHVLGRRRSTSSSSSNTVNSGSVTINSMQRSHMQMRRQLEQRRNTIATATVGGGDDFVKISQRI